MTRGAIEHLLFTTDDRENLTNTVTQIQNIYIPITVITYDVGLYATMYRTGLALALALNVVNKHIYVCIY